MLIEIHMIQNHSPANLNRDDLGAPKTCLFGGVTRARISSQCLKRSIRNPGRPESPDDPDSKRKGASPFVEAMGEHIGVRTKLFPWLVKQELMKTQIPEDEHDRVVLAAQRIATAKEKEQKKEKGEKADSRPKTPQLISFGRGDAKRFVTKLAQLRTPEEGQGAVSDRYSYFLNPRVGFEEIVRAELEDSGLDAKVIDKIVKSSWVVAKCRMNQLQRDAEEEQPEQPEAASEEVNEVEAAATPEQPGEREAKRIAAALLMMARSDEKADKDRFKELTKKKTTQEKGQIDEDSPEKPDKMKDFDSALKESLTCRAVDFALFGRMTTSDAFEDIEAAMQVAHAISTHAVVNEVDYWTAVDDLGTAGGGAGHVAEAMFNSACFYKYFCLDWNQLVHNLAGPEPDEKKDAQANEEWKNKIKPEAERLAACTVGHFLRAAAMTTPSGKQNSFASNCEPCGILVEIKRNGKHATSYANAFAEPARRLGEPPDDAPDYVSLLGRSIAMLGDHVFQMRRSYGTDSTLFWHAMPLYRFPLQGWKREPDGRKAKVKSDKGEPTDKDEPPVQFADKCFAEFGGEPGKPEGLIEAVIENLGFTWQDVREAGKAGAEA